MPAKLRHCGRLASLIGHGLESDIIDQCSAIFDQIAADNGLEYNTDRERYEPEVITKDDDI